MKTVANLVTLFLRMSSQSDLMLPAFTMSLYVPPISSISKAMRPLPWLVLMPQTIFLTTTRFPSTIGIDVRGASMKGLPFSSTRSVTRMPLLLSFTPILYCFGIFPVFSDHRRLQWRLPHFSMPHAASSSSRIRFLLRSLLLWLSHRALFLRLQYMSSSLP